MGKKKFINKKSSATFQLFARDTSALPASSAAGDTTLSDRVFVRVDKNSYSVHGLADINGDSDGDCGESDSIFADALDDTDEEGIRPLPWIGGDGGVARGRPRGPLPDDVRREILELGFPDDGYNYLLHLREIKNSGGGSSYYHNSKAKLDEVSLDVKAYDASRLRISSEGSADVTGESMYTVASKSVDIKVQKAVDPDVLRLLDDGDLSRFGSDVEDLEEDFVVQANLIEGEEEQVDDEVEVCKGEETVNADKVFGVGRGSCLLDKGSDSNEGSGDDKCGNVERPRVCRLLDEQFDMLTLQEYGDDSDDDDCIDNEGELLATKLKDALKEYPIDDFELEDKYRPPGDFVHGHQVSSTGKPLDISTDVIRRCMEYADKYCDDDQDNEDVIIVEESSDESEAFDCQTIVSTYSNLDNHPGKIQAPENPKGRIMKNLSGGSTIKSSVIALRGKEKLPVEYLRHSGRSNEKVMTKVNSAADQPKRRPHGEESKEEKKERKAAVKEERRDARRAKKELKGLYKSETQRGQKVAAVSGPSSIHLIKQRLAAREPSARKEPQSSTRRQSRRNLLRRCHLVIV